MLRRPALTRLWRLILVRQKMQSFLDSINETISNLEKHAILIFKGPAPC